ncbi:MAG TPA: hypothetical protein VKZ79_00720 [Alphaproteobacteria bacterium]|nr:hypothetical protein [Alphaproteobacteria bacterium]
MEKRRLSSASHSAAIIAAASLAGCGTLTRSALEPDQQQDLAAYVEAYHFCVARTASRLDDGKSAIVDISAQALGYCEPEARGVANYLNSTKLSDSAKAKYVTDLIRTATTRSEIMLRRLRDRQSGITGI